MIGIITMQENHSIEVILCLLSCDKNNQYSFSGDLILISLG
jgi:hypothetical protein